VLGAWLVIAAGQEAPPNRALLARPALVWLGLISYPLYLWHWPLLAYLRILSPEKVPATFRALAACASVPLAALTWRFAETPVRTRSFGATRTLALTGALALLGAGGAMTYAAAGFPFRVKEFAERKQSLTLTLRGGHDSPWIEGRCALYADPAAKPKNVWCYQDNREAPRYLLIGDSHAAALYPGLVAESTPGHRWGFVGLPGCEFLTGGVRKASRDGEEMDATCHRLAHDTVDALVANPAVRGVLIVLAYRDLDLDAYAWEAAEGAPATNEELFVAGETATVTALQRAGKDVAFLVDNPEITDNPAACVVARPITLLSRHATCSVPRSEHERAIREFRASLAAHVTRTGALVVDPTDAVYCDEHTCSVTKDGASLYAYTDHLSDVGNAKVAALFLARTGWR
jgi:hypothetical protein